MKRALKILIANFILMVVVENIISASPYILSNVFWQGKSLGGMTVNGAAAYMESNVEKMLARPITFTVNGNNHSYNGYELGYTADVQEMAKQAWQWGRQGFFWQRWYERGSIEALPTKWVWHKSATIKILTRLSQNYRREVLPANARLINGRLQITEAQNGSFADMSGVMPLLQKDYSKIPDNIAVPFYPILAYPSTKLVQTWGWETVCGKCTTYYSMLKTDRSHNLKTAADLLDGYIIYSGAVISFNALTGERNEANGYKKAPIILNGRLADDYGGGVCQVSSTLYNAVLEAGGAFKIIERHMHSRPVGYLPKGKDAAVSYGHKDLVFQYMGETPLLLHATAQNGILNVQLRGVAK